MRIAQLSCLVLSAALVLACAQQPAREAAPETVERARIAAANLEDAVVVDCQLPGKLQKLGGQRTYLTPGRLLRLSAIDCRTRGGEYTLGDLASGTLSLKRWMPLAEKGDAEAQYYVARIYSNGMDGVPVDYARAAEWYKRAADQGYQSAMQELGYLYEDGLGVPKEPLLALDLQRKASGLGEELDYASKITEARADAARQVGEISQRLEEANTQLQELRTRLASSDDQLTASRGELSRARVTSGELRRQLEQAKVEQAKAGGSQNAERVKQLEQKLASSEAALAERQKRLETLEADLSESRSQLTSRLAQSQADSMELNELLASRKGEADSLRARLAQAEQRFIRSQDELNAARAQFRQEVTRFASEREQLQRARTAAGGGATSQVLAGQKALAAQEKELQRRQERIRSLEEELAKTTQAQDDSGAAAVAKAQSDLKALRASLAAMQQRYENQLRRQGEALSNQQAAAFNERADVARKLTEQLNQRTVALDQQQRRMASLESEADQLRDEVSQLRAQRVRESTAATNEAERLRNTLAMAQQKLGEQRDQLAKVQTESAGERVALLKARDQLRVQLTAGQHTNEREANVLKAEIAAREATIKAKNERITALEQQIKEQTTLVAGLPPSSTGGGLTLRSVQQPSSTPPRSDGLLSVVRKSKDINLGNYQALVIANSHYRYIPGLVTPASDAKALADLLEQRYGFKVRVLNDATADDIMRTLHEYTLTLAESDNFLIYYAGHGGTPEGPPERAFWLGVEAEPDTQVGWLSAEMVRAKIKQMNARHILLVADSCFSGSITHPSTTVIGRSMTERRFMLQVNRRARMVLTSGLDTPVIDSAGDRTHSVFAKYFLQVLRQNDNVLSGEMLSHELSGRITAESTRLGMRQSPTYSSLNDANHDFGDFFFVPAASRLAEAGS